MSIDPLTLAVVRNGLRHIANEMDLVHQKSAFSPIISETLDRANGIYERDTGEVVAQGDTGLPTFVGVMQFTVQAVIERRSDFEPGDIFVVNDPYFGGTHLMDVKMVMPFYYQGRLWCFLANTGHWPDIGGMVPGGFATTATEIQQEGLRLPPVKLCSRGELDRDLLDIILSNVRVPEERIGDIRAQIGALKVGARSLTAFLDRYGADVVEEAIAELKQRTEQQVRAIIAEIPDGTYRFWSDLDNDGVDDSPLHVEMELTVDGSDLHIDLSNSSPPCRGPMNSVWAITRSALYIGMKHLFPDVPINAGCFKPIHIRKPEGTFLYAEYPRPVSGCAAEVSQRLVIVLFGALAKALPGKVAALPFASAGNFSLGGHDPATGRNYVMVIVTGGGYGGSTTLDGLSNGSPVISSCKTQPIEILEQRYPILFEEYALRQDSAGAGRRRGGLGIQYSVRMRRGTGVASFMMECGRSGALGLYGGGSGALNEIRIVRGERTETLPRTSKGEGIELREDEGVQVRTPGGGGYGPPQEREHELVSRDVELGYVSDQAAQQLYLSPARPAVKQG